MKKIRIGVGMLGAGFMGKAHSNAFKTIPYMYYPLDYEIDLVAVGASTKAKADMTAQRYGYARGYDDWEKLVRDPDVTVFSNGAPDPLHIEPVLAAIECGKHIMCEKPLAMNSADAKKMLDAAEKKGVKHMTLFNYRFFPANMLARRLIQSGALGTLCHISVTYAQPYGVPAELPYEKIWYNNDGKADGTGQGIGTHAIDMARFLTGEMLSVSGLSRVYVKQRKNAKGELIDMTGEEGMLALVDFECGASGSLQALEIASGHLNKFEWELLGTNGSLSWNLQSPNYLKVYLRDKDAISPDITGFTDVSVTDAELGHPYGEYWWPKGHNIGWEHGHINAIKHFFDCVAHDQDVSPLGATFLDGYKAEVVLEAIRASSLEGRRMDIVY